MPSTKSLLRQGSLLGRSRNYSTTGCTEESLPPLHFFLIAGSASCAPAPYCLYRRLVTVVLSWADTGDVLSRRQSSIAMNSVPLTYVFSLVLSRRRQSSIAMMILISRKPPRPRYGLRANSDKARQDADDAKQEEHDLEGMQLCIQIFCVLWNL
jgi:hypothetical protein